MQILAVQPLSADLAADVVTFPDHLIHSLAVAGVGLVEAARPAHGDAVPWWYTRRRGGESRELARLPIGWFRPTLARLRPYSDCPRIADTRCSPPARPRSGRSSRSTASRSFCATSRQWASGRGSTCIASTACGRWQMQRRPNRLARLTRPAHSVSRFVGSRNGDTGRSRPDSAASHYPDGCESSRLPHEQMHVALAVRADAIPGTGILVVIVRAARAPTQADGPRRAPGGPGLCAGG